MATTDLAPHPSQMQDLHLLGAYAVVPTPSSSNELRYPTVAEEMGP